MQIGCKCPPHKQDLFLELVRGFGAREVAAEWRQQLMVVGEGLAEEEGGGGGGGRTRRQQQRRRRRRPRRRP
jgi:hypothetical protein